MLGTKDIIVVIEGEHSCMTTRGIKSRGSKTKTATLREESSKMKLLLEMSSTA